MSDSKKILRITEEDIEKAQEERRRHILIITEADIRPNPIIVITGEDIEAANRPQIVITEDDL